MSRSCVLLVLVLLSGCASTHVYERSFPEGAALAEVHFIRHNYPPTLRGTHIYANNVLVADLANNDRVAVMLPAGKSIILIEADDGKPLTFEMDLGAGQTRYMVYTGSVDSMGTQAQGNTITTQLRWNLLAYEVDKSQAETILKVK